MSGVHAPWCQQWQGSLLCTCREPIEAAEAECDRLRAHNGLLWKAAVKLREMLDLRVNYDDRRWCDAGAPDFQRVIDEHAWLVKEERADG